MDLLNFPRYTDACCRQYSTVDNYKNPHQLTLIPFCQEAITEYLSTIPEESKSLYKVTEIMFLSFN